MARIVVDGGRITVPSSVPGKRSVIDFGAGLLSCTEFPDGFVVEYRMPVIGKPLIVDKLSYVGGMLIWRLVPQRTGEIAVTPDNRTLIINDIVSVTLPSEMRFALSLPDGVATVVSAEPTVGPRNLFFYGYDGACRWRVAEWARFAQLPIYYVSQVEDTQNLRAVLRHGGQALILDRANGAVLDQVDAKE